MSEAQTAELSCCSGAPDGDRSLRSGVPTLQTPRLTTFPSVRAQITQSTTPLTGELSLTLGPPMIGTDRRYTTGKDANSGPTIGAEIIDLRNETNVSISDDDPASASSVSITAAGGVDISATNADMLLVSDAGGEDYLVNKEYLYGSGKGVFGSDTISDINGDGFDVITSARLDDFNDLSHQIFYDGDHTDFNDTRDDDSLSYRPCCQHGHG